MLKHPKATEDAIGCGTNFSQVIQKPLKNLKKTGKNESFSLKRGEFVFLLLTIKAHHVVPVTVMIIHAVALS
ncbi:hypothetical protein RV02_GL002195 [Enterococcus gilvus]|uniref:Uncharacterized protein n=1 Tax=Enterococcus gilvus ATCC BAA-350 TaxID=1158614 RepID=R2XVP4_9ENTE|nr:hypothetical protein UKC_00185 [Enterococcus gilvus ATCC BAA-350]EOW79124.1 hypothetical protein I592_03262 [Enterococcus gilvus ATCC BAA-350]OJG43811.1 hypothetical protein RV02_GL002195 [Enterococcus gilvus]